MALLSSNAEPHPLVTGATREIDSLSRSAQRQLLPISDKKLVLVLLEFLQHLLEMQQRPALLILRLRLQLL